MSKSRLIPFYFSYVLLALASLASPLIGQVLSLGETLLAAVMIISVTQALIAIYLYKYDVRGQLPYPDGLTIGVEECQDDADENDNIQTNTEMANDANNPNNYEATSQHDMNRNLSEINDQSPIIILQLLKKLNKGLFLLLPWMIIKLHTSIPTNVIYLFRVGFIISLGCFVKDVMKNEIDEGDSNEYDSPTLFEKLADDNINPLRVLVIGDSLSIGIGCIQRFDSEKDNSIPMKLVEKTKLADDLIPNNKRQGPVFPQVFARSLSQRFKLPVYRRSAGVDGGEVTDIERFCIDVVKEEASSNSTNNHKYISSGYVSGKPDIVVVLFGLNDVKNLLVSSEFGTMSKFLDRIDSILQEIHQHAPNAIVVFPALPVLSFHKHCVVNMFPCAMVVDTILHFFLRQKKKLVNKRVNCMYADMTADELRQWCKSENDGEHSVDGELLSKDGIHPTKLTYKLWAESVCQSFYDNISPQIEVESPMMHKSRFHERSKLLSS